MIKFKSNFYLIFKSFILSGILGRPKQLYFIDFPLDSSDIMKKIHKKSNMKLEINHAKNLYTLSLSLNFFVHSIIFNI